MARELLKVAATRGEWNGMRLAVPRATDGRHPAKRERRTDELACLEPMPEDQLDGRITRLCRRLSIDPEQIGPGLKGTVYLMRQAAAADADPNAFGADVMALTSRRDLAKQLASTRTHCARCERRSRAPPCRTVARYDAPDGAPIHGVGVEPDIVAEGADAAAAALEAALVQVAVDQNCVYWTERGAVLSDEGSLMRAKNP